VISGSHGNVTSPLYVSLLMRVESHQLLWRGREARDGTYRVVLHVTMDTAIAVDVTGRRQCSRHGSVDATQWAQRRVGRDTDA